jgi:uncharacterized membrane protein ArfC
MVLTFTLLLRPAKHQVPVGASTGGAGATSKPPAKQTTPVESRTKKKPVTKDAPTTKIPVAKKSPKAKTSIAKGPARRKIPVAKESATRKIPVAKGPATRKIRVAKESATTQIPVAKESATTQIPTARFAPYGPGSARADADGSGPAGWLVKGRSDTRHYYTPDDPSYDATVAQVWFQNEASAARAFFTPWSKSARRN